VNAERELLAQAPPLLAGFPGKVGARSIERNRPQTAAALATLKEKRRTGVYIECGTVDGAHASQTALGRDCSRDLGFYLEEFATWRLPPCR
jgi:hypothetical protein